MKYFLASLSLVLGLLFITSCDDSNSSELTSYHSQIQNHRDTTNLEFKDVDHSPLVKDSISSFTGLNYYPVDENWNIHASFKQAETEEIIKIATTTDRIMEVLVAGEINFLINGVTQSLMAYRYMDSPESGLFVPFLDQTNGDETYGGGRYVETRNPTSDSVWVDFNMAYNPYCCYNHDYSCPIPPLTNFLEIEIPVGEKTLYHH